MDDEFSYDFDNKQDRKVNEAPGTADKVPETADKVPITADKLPKIHDMLVIQDGIKFLVELHEKGDLSEQHIAIMAYVLKYGKITSKKVVEILDVKQRRARDILGELVAKNMLEKKGNYRNTVYVQKVG